MDSDQQENAGEKTSDATPLGKPIQRKTSGKNMQSVSKAIWKPMQRRGGRCGKACMDVKAEQPGAKKLQRIFKEVCSCERRGFRGYGFV